MKKLLILAALAAASFGQPAFARTASETAAVQHKDLDLRTEAGTKALDRRIWRAVVEVCGKTSDFDLTGKNEVRQCRKDTRLVASAQAEQVIANASRDPLIQVTSIRK